MKCPKCNRFDLTLWFGFGSNYKGEPLPCCPCCGIIYLTIIDSEKLRKELAAWLTNKL